MPSESTFCKLIAWLHRKCAGPRASAEESQRLREASHTLNNEVMVLKGQVFKVKQSADELNDLVNQLQARH